MLQQSGHASDGFFKFSALFRVIRLPRPFIRPSLLVAIRDDSSLDDSATHGHN
jgi:hypothetical protein